MVWAMNQWMRRETDDCPISVVCSYGEFRNFLKVTSTTSNPQTLKLLYRMSGRCSTRELETSVPHEEHEYECQNL